MPIIQPILHAQIDPSKPVQELCDIASALEIYHRGHEVDMYRGLIAAAQARIEQMKGVSEDGEPVLQPQPAREDQG